jgi:hypothetical protein
MTRIVLTAALLAAISTAASAQDTAPANPLLTRPGWEVGGQVAKYHYEEPNFAKLTGSRGGAVGAYTFMRADHVYIRIDGRNSYGSLKYEGSGVQNNNPDWIIEARAVIGKDFPRGRDVVLSPYMGLGYRYLYADGRGYTSTGAAGYRRYSHYLYAPVGLTARVITSDRWIVAPTVEYDIFIRGRQESMLSDAGVVQVDGIVGVFPDVSNTQRHGRGYRASLMFEKDHWAFGPWMHYWNIKDSDIQFSGGVFWREPANWTREYGVELRYRF